jgi:tetratricopeptide (TPR) repeat protein
MAWVLTQTASIYQQQGEYNQAIDYEERSLKLEKERGDEEGQAISLHQLSILYMLQGDYPTALARSQEAEKLNRSSGRKHLLAGNLHQQGLILTALARAAQTEEEGTTYRRAALERFQQSLAIRRRIEDQAGAADTLGELGKLLRDAGQMREAIAAFNEALDIFTRLGNPAKIGLVLQDLGIIHERQAQYEAALEKYQQALGIVERAGAVREAEIIRRHIVRVQAKLRGG